MTTPREVFVGNKFITNPVIINIGVSQYVEHKNLDCCRYDVDNMNKLWSEKYGFKNIYNSTESGFVTFDDFKNILEAAQTKIFTDTTIDSLILSFSGHGNEDSIFLSDSGRYNAYKIQDIIKFFSGNAVPSRFANCPKIIILDKCRGGRIPKPIQHNKTKRSKGDNNTALYHPEQEFVVLYSNTDGYISWGIHKEGGYLIRAICDILGNNKYISQRLELCALVKMIRNRAMKLSGAELHKSNINTMQCIELHDTLTHNVYFGDGSNAKRRREEKENRPNDNNGNYNNNNTTNYQHQHGDLIEKSDKDNYFMKLPSDGSKKRCIMHKYRRKLYVGFREYYVSKNGEQLPSKKGINLTLEQWEFVNKHIDVINAQIKLMRH